MSFGSDCSQRAININQMSKYLQFNIYEADIMLEPYQSVYYLVHETSLSVDNSEFKEIRIIISKVFKEENYSIRDENEKYSLFFNLYSSESFKFKNFFSKTDKTKEQDFNRSLIKQYPTSASKNFERKDKDWSQLLIDKRPPDDQYRYMTIRNHSQRNVWIKVKIQSKSIHIYIC